MLASREFFARPALEVAPELLDARLTIVSDDGVVTVRISETEAYHGLGTGAVHDAGSHARMGRTERNASMFGEPGHLYVYFSYGMHNAVNVVCSPNGVASGVLLRAGEIVEGEELAWSRRAAARAARDLARGPGRLAQALGLRYRDHDGIDALSPLPAEPTAHRAAGRASGRASGGAADHAADRASAGAANRASAGAADATAARGFVTAHLELAATPPAAVSQSPRTGVSGDAGSDAFPWRFYIDGDPTVSPYRAATPRAATARARRTRATP